MSYKLHWIMSPYIHLLLQQVVSWDIYVFMQFDAVIVA